MHLDMTSTSMHLDDVVKAMHLERHDIHHSYVLAIFSMRLDMTHTFRHDIVKIMYLEMHSKNIAFKKVKTLLF